MSTYTRIQITVEVEGSSYSPDWTIGAIQKQAREEAVQGLINLIYQKELRIKVIGNPVVLTMVDVEDKK